MKIANEAHSEDPQFYQLLKTLDTYRAILNEKTTIVLSSLAAVVAATDPVSLANPLGGISKNLGLLACAAVVWALAPITPNASRASGRRRKSG